MKKNLVRHPMDQIHTIKQVNPSPTLIQTATKDNLSHSEKPLELKDEVNKLRAEQNKELIELMPEHHS